MNDITYTKLMCLNLTDFEIISRAEDLYKTKYKFKCKEGAIFLDLYSYIYTTHLDVFPERKLKLGKHRHFSSFDEFLYYLRTVLDFQPDEQFERRVFIEENLKEYIDS